MNGGKWKYSLHNFNVLDSNIFPQVVSRSDSDEPSLLYRRFKN